MRPALALSFLLSSLATLAVAGQDDPVTLRKVSDEVFGDTGGTGGDGGHGALWARQEVVSASPAPKSTGFSTIIKASPTATATPTAVAASATADANPLSSATALPAAWLKELNNLTMTTKVALAVLATISVLLLITTIIVCLRRRSEAEEEAMRDEVPPMAFDDRATTMPKSKHSYRRKSYRLFNENQ